jgi:hypothetical protein
MSRADQIADLELRLRRRDADYAAELRFTPAGQAVSAELAGDVSVRFDHTALLTRSLDQAAYGVALSAMLLADPALRSGWAQARAHADGAGAILCVRLRLDVTDDELHSIYWETLHDPLTDSPLALSERVRFSRYLESADLTPVIIPEQPDLKALIVVANPSNLPDYGLASIDADGEIARAQSAFGSIPPTVLSRKYTGAPVTLSAITTALRNQPHVLHLIAHGTIVQGEPYLWLEDTDGRSKPTAGREFVQALTNVVSRPLLITLASCQSAGQGNGSSALMALGPQLARAGIAAVLAMQDNISMQTIERFTPTFLQELLRDGAVDRAVAAARTAIREYADWWKPVLFVRVRDGRLWRTTAPSSMHTSPAPEIPQAIPAVPIAAVSFHQRLRQTLRACDEFGSNATLKAVFAAPELKPWQGGVPETDSLNARVNLLIAYLEPKRHANGATVLELFLRVLATAYDDNDERHQTLQALANQARQR